MSEREKCGPRKRPTLACVGAVRVTLRLNSRGGHDVRVGRTLLCTLGQPAMQAGAWDGLGNRLG